MSDPEARALDERIERFIGVGEAGDAAFERIALDLFAYQFSCNQPYRRYCEQVGQSPETVRRWEDVPAIPTQAFALARLACFPESSTRLTFLSSGTTTAGARRSRHELESGWLYDASLLAHFKACVIPDLARIRMIVLHQPFAGAPESSLAYMLSKISAIFGTSDDRFCLGAEALRFDEAVNALAGCEPVLVVGTALAFAHFIERCDAAALRFNLAFGSRVVETGGFKGKSREMSRGDLYAAFTRVLGVPRVFCLSEYGMCELGSQWYDANLMDFTAGKLPRTETKVGPHWARTRIVDPASGQPAARGDKGLLQVFDLSNRGSVAAVLTGDLARELESGFELLGRHPGAAPKGCSIAVDALLSAQRD